jgi:hypothetical protein
MDWIHQAQGKDKWKAPVKVVMNLGFHKILGYSQVAEQLVGSQE